MNDTIQLVPSVPVLPRQAPVRPDHVVEPAKNTQTENRGANDGQHSTQQDAPANRHLTISRHDTLNTYVYRSIEEESGDVLWQYPAENMLRMSQHWRDMEARESSQHEVDQKV